MSTYTEERNRAAALQSSIFDFRLLRQILSTLNRRVHAFDCQESSQIGGVRWDHDEREKPPHAGDDAERRNFSISGESLEAERIVTHRVDTALDGVEGGGRDES